MIAQLALAAAFAALAAFAWKVRGTTSGLPGSELALAATLAFLVAFFSATQDIAYDAYAVEAIRPEEQGPVSGLRIAWYRVGMLVAGAATVSLSDWLPWPVLFLGLGAIFVAFVPVTLAGVGFLAASGLKLRRLASGAPPDPAPGGSSLPS